MLQHGNAVINAQRQESTVEQMDALLQELAAEKQRVKQLEQLMDDLSTFANQKTSLTRRLQIVESELEQKTKEAREAQDRHLAELGRQRAQLELKYKKQIQDAYQQGVEEAEQRIDDNSRLLREQNIELQRSLAIIKKDVEKPKELDFSSAVSEDFTKVLEKKIAQ